MSLCASGTPSSGPRVARRRRRRVGVRAPAPGSASGLHVDEGVQIAAGVRSDRGARSRVRPPRPRAGQRQRAGPRVTPPDGTGPRPAPVGCVPLLDHPWNEDRGRPRAPARSAGGVALVARNHLGDVVGAQPLVARPRVGQGLDAGGIDRAQSARSSRTRRPSCSERPRVFLVRDVDPGEMGNATSSFDRSSALAEGPERALVIRR